MKLVWVFSLLLLASVVLGFTAQRIFRTDSAPQTDTYVTFTAPPVVTHYAAVRKRITSIDEIFQYKDPDNRQSGANAGEYTIIATGDVMLARSVNIKMDSLDNYRFPFEKTAEILYTADAVFINLETPLMSGCPPTNEGMIFCADEKAVEGLTYAGIRVANIANNHANNQGLAGIQNTVDVLEKNGISVSGGGEPAVVMIRDKKFGFTGFNDVGLMEAGVAWADIEQVTRDIQDLKRQVDYVIAAFHWGVEYTYTPTDRQRELAHSAIDAGADLIIGNHPHWVQGVEIYKDKIISYSHGNFVFDQMWSRETREGVIGEYVFDRFGVSSIGFYPVIIEQYAQPRFASEKEAIEILNHMKTSSQRLYALPTGIIQD